MEPAREAWGAVERIVADPGAGVDPRFATWAATFLAELARWNAVGRLTGYRGEAAQIRHLILESLLLLRVLPEPAAPVLDIGTGPGVPGLFLKMARPDWEVVLIDATRRRVSFVRHVVRTLGLGGIEVLSGRSESLAREGQWAGRFATVTMRAVAAPAEARVLARPFLAPAGRLVLPLGPRTEAAAGGVVREVELGGARGTLPLRRRFLIIDRGELSVDVPRGT